MFRFLDIPSPPEDVLESASGSNTVWIGVAVLLLIVASVSIIRRVLQKR